MNNHSSETAENKTFWRTNNFIGNDMDTINLSTHQWNIIGFMNKFMKNQSLKNSLHHLYFYLNPN